MSRLRATTPVEVDLGPCECPGTPHADGDKAWLRPRLTAEGGLWARVVAETAQDATRTYADLGWVFLVDGLLRWNLLADDGKLIPTDEATLRSGALDWDSTLVPIVEKGYELYTQSIIVPLLRGRQTPSQLGQTDDSTSQSLPSTSESPESPEPSMTSTTEPSPPTGSPTSSDSNS